MERAENPCGCPKAGQALAAESWARLLLQCQCPHSHTNSSFGDKDAQKGTGSHAQEEKLKALHLRCRQCSTNETIVNVP